VQKRLPSACLEKASKTPDFVGVESFLEMNFPALLFIEISNRTE